MGSHTGSINDGTSGIKSNCEELFDLHTLKDCLGSCGGKMGSDGVWSTSVT